MYYRAHQYLHRVDMPATAIENELHSLCGLTRAETSQVTATPGESQNSLLMNDSDEGVGPKVIPIVCKVLARLIGNSKTKIELTNELETLDNDRKLGRVPFQSVISLQSMRVQVGI